MNAVTKQEIVSLIEGLIESDACMGSLSDKQVIMSLELVSRIKQYGIAPEKDARQVVPAITVGYAAPSSLADLARGECSGIMIGSYSERYGRTHPLYTAEASMEQVAAIIKNEAGQIRIVDTKGNSFDMSKYVGVKLFAIIEEKKA